MTPIRCLALFLFTACTIGGTSPSSPPADAGSHPPTGHWQTQPDPVTHRYQFVGPDGNPIVMRGLSMTGLETGTRETAGGGGFWLFQSGAEGFDANNVTVEATNAPQVLENVTRSVVQHWGANIVRIPICGSAWTQNYMVHSWYGTETLKDEVRPYRDWLDIAVRAARDSGAVVIIDNHVWAIAAQSGSAFEDGSPTAASAAPMDWYTSDPRMWECPLSNADGVSLHNAVRNTDHIAAMWSDIANHYKGDPSVWFEVYNEPYVRSSTGANITDDQYPWDLWSQFMMRQIQAIRGTGAENIVIVNGLDFGYDFGPTNGPIAHPDQYLPWRGVYSNIAYGFHPYQHATCCGAIGATTDESTTDPYESAFCSYYSDGSTTGNATNVSMAPLPTGGTCSVGGYAATSDKKMPPCTWVASAWNPATKALGLCAGDRNVCNSLDQTACSALDRTQPAAGGWAAHVLPMASYGPLIATEYGSFDCSSPYVANLLRYLTDLGISYTAWSVWPRNEGGPSPVLGACGYPSVMQPIAAGDFRQCVDGAQCKALMHPLAWAGMATASAIKP